MSNFSNNSSGNYNSSCRINNTMATLFHTSLYNTTNCTNSSGSPASQGENPPANPWAIFYEVSYYSSFVIIVIAFITILANALLLIVFVVDPLKTFRTPTSLFLISLALADMVTAVTAEPFNATCFLMLHYSYPNLKAICTPLFKAGQRISNVSMNISYFTVLELTVIQFIVIKSPLRYGRNITKVKVVICILLTWVYCISYTCLYFVEDQNTQVILSKIDVFFHTICMIVTMSLFYGLLYHEFHRKMARGATLRNESSTRHKKEMGKTSRLQRKFVSLNFFLILLLYSCSLPSVVVWLLIYYRFHGQVTPKLLTAQLMTDIMLFLKFMLDPIIYAWRLPQYREALVFMVKGRRNPHNGVMRSSRASVSNATMATICDGNDSFGKVSLSHFEPKRKKDADQKDEKDTAPPACSSYPVSRQAPVCSLQGKAVPGTQLNGAACVPPTKYGATDPRHTAIIRTTGADS